MGDRVRVCYKRRLPSLPARNGLLLCHGTPVPDPLFRDGTAPVFRANASAMQRPTLANVRIRSTRDAAHIFLAVAQNRLPMTVRRLDAEERRAIVSGNVYVWEERGANSEATGLGIERWSVFSSYSTVYRAILTGKCRTDGMRWSPSRVRDVRALSFHFCLFP